MFAEQARKKRLTSLVEELSRGANQPRKAVLADDSFGQRGDEIRAFAVQIHASVRGDRSVAPKPPPVPVGGSLGVAGRSVKEGTDAAYRGEKSAMSVEEEQRPHTCRRIALSLALIRGGGVSGKKLRKETWSETIRR